MMPPLDLLSTSQTFGPEMVSQHEVGSALYNDILMQFEQAKSADFETCERGAPYIFFVDNSGRARIVQGSCNNWLCPRCGQLRALREYGRIVHGARQIAEQGHALYFLTLTCQG